jgi:hypothetical protein
MNMSTVPIGRRTLADHRSGRLFYLAITAVFGALVFTGFARSFYLHTLFGVNAPAPFFVFHGVVMSGWIALLIAQATLISARRVQWHRWLGVFGVGYAALMVVVGCMSTLKAAAREASAHSAMLASQFNVLALELTQMALFAGLVSAAVVLRRRPDWHKRLMILATLCLLPNPIVRLSMLSTAEFLSHNIVLVSLWALLVAAVGVVDSYRRRSVHPVYGVLGTGAVACMYVAYFIGRSESWMRFAARLVS